ncbi:MAG: esterase [Deltaproteobacteria bacterium]|nr:esterase [Deltaproteobacteria bacterium]
MRRRELLGAVAGLLGAAGCDRHGPGKSGTGRPAPATATSTASVAGGHWRELSFAPGAHWSEPEHAALLVGAADQPLLVALHGRGEAGRGLKVGARGWRDDYDLDLAHQRLKRPPLTEKDFHGFVAPVRLAALNASLAAKSYAGLTVACPYAPALRDRSLAGARGFASFVTEVLVPRVRQELGLPKERKRTGIDGVSMGGRLALLVGLSHPELFSAVGALQPAISVAEAEWLARLAATAGARHPMKLRLVSSEDDPFLPAVQAFAKALDERQVAHQVIVTPGPHDYIWNRGPGSYEMLLWHERVLRGLAAP